MKQCRIIQTFILFIAWATLSFGQEKTIRIVATSDVHGALFPYDFLNDTPGGSSLAAVETFLDSLRSLADANLVLLDNGDLIQGTVTAYYANFVQKGHTNLFSRVMNRLKYDAATLGNHDIEAGPAIYKQLEQQFNFPWLGANIIEKKSGKPAFTPFTVVERNGIKIAILGMITPSVPDWLPERLWPGLEFHGMEQEASFWLDHIRKTADPDLVIGLFHTGMGQTESEIAGKHPENAGQLIAQNIPGFDVIILGHDHRPVNETLLNKSGKPVIVVNPGSSTRQIAYIELKVQAIENNKYIIINSIDTLISMEKIRPSASYLQSFAKDYRKVRAYANQPVGRLPVSLSARDGLFGNSGFTDLVHAMQLENTVADVSFTAPFALNETLAAGPVRIRDLFKLYRYENFLYTMNMTGKEIKDYLEYSYGLWFSQMQHPEDNLLNFRKDKSGQVILNSRGKASLAHPSYNFDSAAGINYLVDVSRPAGDRITIREFENGKTFSEDSLYRVAMNSYRASGGGGHLTEGAGILKEKIADRIIGESDQEVRTMLIDYLKVKKSISPGPRGNWKVIPESWWEKAWRKDAGLFY